MTLTSFHDALTTSVDGFLQSGAEKDNDLPVVAQNQ